MHNNTGNSRSGVALVVVLGLVAILLIVSVAFTIHMRVERAGAANLRHAAVARHVVKGALAAAIAAIDDDIVDDFSPPWYDFNNPARTIYSRDMYVATEHNTVRKNFWKDTFISFDSNAVDHIADSFFTPEVERYFPSGSSYKGYALKYGAAGSQTTIQQPEWIPFRDDDGGVMGRYAFFVLDTSGLLDASCVNREDRWIGKTPAEIRLSEKILPEVDDVNGLSDNMVSDGRYDSFAEFRALNEEKDPVIKHTRSFSTFSYEPMPTNSVYIGGGADEIRASKQQIIRAFYDCGLTAGKSFGAKDSEQARWAYLGLVDYVDDGDDMETDDKIEPFERPVTENMPVMSGFIAKFTVEAHERVVEDGKVGDTDEPAYKIADKCSMTMSVVFKVPFVYPFMKQAPAQAGDLKLNAKATIFAPKLPASAKGANGDKELRKLIDKFEGVIGSGTSGWGGQDDNAIEIKPETFTVTSDEVKLVTENGKRTPSKLKGMEMFFRAAGGTWFGSVCQHRYPIKDTDYSDHYAWMTSSFAGFGDNDNEKKHDFLDDSDADGKYCVEKEAKKDDGTPAKDKTGKVIKYKVWTPEPVVVWAEFVDPRFASLEMADITGDFSESEIAEDQFVYYRPSHLPSTHATQFQFDYPVTELKGRFPGEFGAFTAADNVTAALFDKDNDMHGGYFNGDSSRNGSGCPGGVSPLASYFLTHPAAVNSVYKMRMDGIRNDSNATKDDTDTAKQQWRAHVKNAPLESVGELGYLPIGMWHTIRLYDYDDAKIAFGTGNLPTRMAEFNHLPNDDDANALPFHPVLDHFTLIKDRKSMPLGRVNINTLNSNVLATVFHFLPVGTEEGSKLYLKENERSTYKKYRIDADASGNETDDSLGLLAKAVMEYRKQSANGVFESLSELGSIFKYGGSALNGDEKGYVAEAVSNAARGDDKMGEFERESVIRNSCGLFTSRGQTFVIVVRGEAYSPMFGKTSVEGGSVNAAKTAVAEIWRDSEPDKNGNHPVFVQFFKIIDD